jgi:excinuclease ABC subunit C
LSETSLDIPTQHPLARGMAVIAAFVETLPNSAGVYRMLNTGGELLYVGKAKNLKKRVTSYAKGIAHSGRILRMIAETTTMEFITTETETEALLLEANLIKQLRPRYNVLLKDDKSFPYVMLTHHEAPQLLRHRGARVDAGDYFGPFLSSWAVNESINTLQRAFLLRTCTDSVYESRTRPCLLHQIKRCSAPCTGEISKQNYAELVGEARDFLQGKSAQIQKCLADEMQTASDHLEFERAAGFRDRLTALSSIQSSQGINPKQVEEADVFAIDVQAGKFCVEVFFFRNWQNWGNRAYFPRADKSLSLDEVLSSFMAQFYADKPAPKLILVSHDMQERALLIAALSQKMGYAVEIAHPKRGEKLDLVNHALSNTKAALERLLSEKSSQGKLLEALAVALKLPHPLRRVEVYDNSHMRGTNAIGAMIVAGESGFIKAQYRTWTIAAPETIAGDDLGMMREVFSRRFSRLIKEQGLEHVQAFLDAQRTTQTETEDDVASDTEDFPPIPDLIVIDGGINQLNAAMQVLTELGLAQLSVVSIAKGIDREAGRETFFMPSCTPFKLPPRDPALYFIERLRDEAHRFAIGTHRAKRSKAFVQNPLDEIVGIGAARKRALMLHFGSAKAVARASMEDLQRASSINAATARLVYQFFQS